MGAWGWAGASCRGVAHARAGTRKQDAFSCFVAGGATLVSIVSDGAGSASHGGEGASLICRTLASAIREHFASSQQLPDDETLWLWIDDTRDRIGVAAQRRGLAPRDFAATLVLITTDGDTTMVAHIGDGCSVVRHLDGTWLAMSWPAQGEYASTTTFVTDDPAPNLRIVRSDIPIDAVASFTDGIERLALDYAGREAHQPFFRGIIAPLETGGATGGDRGLSGKLAAYLDSAAMCDRTDDDKTLVIATRR